MNINVKAKIGGFVTRIEVRDKDGNLVQLMGKKQKNSILGQATFLNSSSSKTSNAYYMVGAVLSQFNNSGAMAWGASNEPNTASMVGLQDLKQDYSINWVQGTSGDVLTRTVYRGDGNWYDSVTGTVAFTAYAGESTQLAEVGIRINVTDVFTNKVVTRCVLDNPIEIKNGYFVTITYEFRFYYPSIAKTPIAFTATQNGVSKSGYLTMPAMNLPGNYGDFINLYASSASLGKYIPFSRGATGQAIYGPLLGGLGRTNHRATLGFTDLPNGLTRNSDGNIEYPENTATTVKMDVEELSSSGNWTTAYAAAPLGLVPNGTCSISLAPAFKGAETLTIYWIYFAGLLFYFPDPITKTGEDALDISLTWSLGHD